jgi:predicted lipoprotein
MRRPLESPTAVIGEDGMASHRTARLLGGIAAAALLVLVASGCSKKEKVITAPEPQDFTAILFSFAHGVVVPTYTDLAAKADSLHTIIVDFNANSGDQAKLNAAAAAWVAAREPWEKSEAFLFGPAAYLTIDPSIDSWPVDRTQLDGVLASSFPLTAQFISQGLGPALRGFHTIEYLLFRDGAPRNVGDLTPRERDYLVAVSQVLLDDATALRNG